MKTKEIKEILDSFNFAEITAYQMADMLREAANGDSDVISLIESFNETDITPFELVSSIRGLIVND